MELELAKCKMDMMSLNSQLLDAIQQKLNLSQQLEAWQVNRSSRAWVMESRAPGLGDSIAGRQRTFVSEALSCQVQSPSPP